MSMKVGSNMKTFSNWRLRRKGKTKGPKWQK